MLYLTLTGQLQNIVNDLPAAIPAAPAAGGVPTQTVVLPYYSSILTTLLLDQQIKYLVQLKALHFLFPAQAMQD
ncbi:hypothetical protein SERLA73DRAFT_78181 [Serpula lacrymans var. lacrymans S7.3]|uniref:Uncharacterized protein n=1 Tax=Serpula lacrymans var. lacrymans (strain S7.3) TaxID=936435 RepID=F8QCE0_SERL3|nr:hypothetical protein SERLA73DRAFT_78181 [Serpula lacrymans var. lacrymans S7.3]